MADYNPPLRDIRFTLERIVGLDSVLALGHYSHIDSATVSDVLDGYGALCRDVIAPTNRAGDLQPSWYDAPTRSVRATPVFDTVFDALADGGWGALPFDADYGGGGFPWLVLIAQQEMLSSANMAYSLCPMLTQGAIDSLEKYGTEEQKETYLRPMIGGRWTGCMVLTEPEAGSDVGALRTRAEEQSDGSYRIFGQKIFITWGDHDLADNIVHMVLARIPGSPPGTKGISLFLVPKFMVNPDGSLGERNDFWPLAVEHKMGIKASPTCVMSYGEDGRGAVGFLVGEPNQGMRLMFTMMNSARLSVGLEGLAIAERAYQDAVTYALQRVQGRPVASGAGDTIIGHPDVRRMLLTMRSQIEAVRALCYENARAIDMARHSTDEGERERDQELADLLTPLSKAWSTDLGNEIASLAIQVFGGIGFIEESGVAQHYRDVRIAAIYEGTNGIQAIDLVGRKLSMRSGGVIKGQLERVLSGAAELAAVGLDDLARAVEDAVATASEATEWLLGQNDPVAQLSGATPYLRLLATVIGAGFMTRQALAANGSDDDFLVGKAVSARFYLEQVLPVVRGLLPQVCGGRSTLLELRPDQFASR